MRVSSNNTYQTSVSTLQQRQQALQQAQEQMTSGKRIAKPSDDPAGIATAERALNAQKRTEAAQRAVAASRNSMTMSEASIGNAIDLTQSAREALLSAGNGAYSASDRNTLALQLRQLRGQLLSVANQGDGATGYVFGGQNGAKQPFSDGVSGVQFSGTGGASNGSPTENLPLSMDGKAVWMQTSSGKSVFDAIDDAVKVLGDSTASSAQVTTAVQAGVGNLDSALSNFQLARTAAGETLNHLDGVENRNSAAILSSQTTRSNAEDLDMVQAISEFTNKQTSYQAALQSYSMVQKLSLFNYLNP
jgi:flagellar hook-associated protein 3 FlgL